MNPVLLSYLAIFTPVLAAGAFLGLITGALWRNLRDRPAPVALTAAGLDATADTAMTLTCPWCADLAGTCTCTRFCGAGHCIRDDGDHGPPAVLTAYEQAALDRMERQFSDD